MQVLSRWHERNEGKESPCCVLEKLLLAFSWRMFFVEQHSGTPPYMSVVMLSHAWLCNLVNCSPPRSFCFWVLLGKNTGVGCQFLLQRIFPTQESKLCFLRLLYCRWILYHWAIMEAPIQVSSTIQSILLWRREVGRGIPLQFRTTGRAQAWKGEKGSLNGSGHCLFSLLPGSAQEDSSAQGRCRCLSS